MHKKRNVLLCLLLSYLNPIVGLFYIGKAKFGFFIFLASLFLFILPAFYIASLPTPFIAPVFALHRVVSILTYFILALYCIIFAKRNGQNYTLNRYNKLYIYVLVELITSLGLFSAINYSKKHVIDMFLVPTTNMTPTIVKGDRVIADMKVTASEINRGDLIVFKFPTDQKTIFLKRVIGLPGDNIEMRNSTLRVNGKDIQHVLIKSELELGSSINAEYFEENYGGKKYMIRIQPISYDGKPPADYSGVVATNQFFVLGDNRYNAHDSRYWGGVPFENVVGRPKQVLFSTSDEVKGIQRIFQPLN